MVESYLITIPAQSNWIPPQDLFVVCYFGKLCIAPVPASLKPEQCRAGQRKLGGFLGKSTKTHSCTQYLRKRQQWEGNNEEILGVFLEKECMQEGINFSAQITPGFSEISGVGEGFVRVFPFISPFLLKSLKISTLLHMLASDSPGCLWYPKRIGSTLISTAAKSLQHRGLSSECTPEPSAVSCPVCTQLAHSDTVWPACVTAWLCPVLLTWPPNHSPSWFRTQEGHVWPCVGEPAGVTSRRDRDL